MSEIGLKHTVVFKNEHPPRQRLKPKYKKNGGEESSDARQSFECTRLNPTHFGVVAKVGSSKIDLKHQPPT